MSTWASLRPWARCRLTLHCSYMPHPQGVFAAWMSIAGSGEALPAAQTQHMGWNCTTDTHHWSSMNQCCRNAWPRCMQHRCSFGFSTTRLQYKCSIDSNTRLQYRCRTGSSTRLQHRCSLYPQWMQDDTSKDTYCFILNNKNMHHNHLWSLECEWLAGNDSSLRQTIQTSTWYYKYLSSTPSCFLYMRLKFPKRETPLVSEWNVPVPLGLCLFPAGACFGPSLHAMCLATAAPVDCCRNSLQCSQDFPPVPGEGGGLGCMTAFHVYSSSYKAQIHLDAISNQLP